MSIIEKEGILKQVDPKTGAVTSLYPEIKTDSTLSVEGKAADAAKVGIVIAGKEEQGIWISQVDYNKLSEEEKNADVSYYIYDAASSTTDIRWISQAEYNALSEEAKMLPIPYYIYDSDVDPNAFAIPFSSDRYNATTVGDALEEVGESVSAVNENLAHDAIPSNINSIVGLVGLVDNDKTKTFYVPYVTADTLTDYPDSLKSISALNLVNIEISKSGTFAYIKINACKSNGDNYTAEGLYNGTKLFWSKGDAGLNSDLVTVDLAISGLNMQPTVDTKLGNVTIPSGYVIVSTDYIPDAVNGGTGWGSLILHSATNGAIYGMSLATITNSSGVIRVLCKKN